MGVELPPHEDFVRQHRPKDGRGLNMAEMAALFADYRVDMEVLEVSPEQLQHLPKPVIARTLEDEQGHFVVLAGYDMSLDRYRIIDGTSWSTIFMPSPSLNQVFSGFVLATPYED
jgi:hypothetical protein